MKKTLALLLTMLIIFSFAFAEYSAVEAGKQLKEMGIIKGDEKGNLNENNYLTRAEAIATLNRMMGADKEAEMLKATSPFTDVPSNHWAAKQIAYAKDKKWAYGIGNNKFGIDRKVTTQEFLTFALRALGHSDRQTYTNALEIQKQYNLLAGVKANQAKDEITRGDVFIIMLNALNAKMSNGQTLAQKLGLEKKNEETQANSTTYPLSLTDGEGVKVTFDKEPMKIVSVAPSVTEILFAVGAGDKVIARTDYCDYPAKALDLPSIGTLMEPNIEKIAELNPDLVIASTHFSEEAAKQLENLGIKVFVLKAQENFDGLYKTVGQAGQITNHQAKATSVITNVKTRVAAVKAKVKDLKPVTCYYSVSTGEKEFTATGDTFISDLITMAGGDNVAKDGQKWSYSLEKLLEHNPEIIMVGNKFDARKTFVELEAHKELDAVKNDKVVEIDGSRIGRLTPRIVESLEEVAKVLHPEISHNESSLVIFLPNLAPAK